MRILLARECELNLWSCKRLKSVLQEIDSNFKSSIELEYLIKERPGGDLIFRSNYPDGDLHSSGSLPNVHTDMMYKLMLDVAALDENLFADLEDAYDSMINLQHVRNSLINHVQSDDDLDRRFFDSFTHYGLSEITDALVDLEHLYKKCTGKELTEHRVR
jgi:hypothetical protein